MNARRVAAVVVPALALLAGTARSLAQTDAAPAAAPASDATTVDWSQEVARACTHPRYGLRLAAGRRVAAAGDTAVPAIRAFAEAHGLAAIPVALVEALADGGGDGAALLDLLATWAQDRDFAWRGQAMKGLLLRSTQPPLGERFRSVFDAHAADPAWLSRTYALLGLNVVWPPPADAPMPGDTPLVHPGDRDDDDPRVAVRFASSAARLPGLRDALRPAIDQRLVAALGDERTFLGDPWGRRRAVEAFAALRELHGRDWGYRADASHADNRAALAAIAADLGVAVPPQLGDPALPFVGGLEVLSCRNGDLFLRWTADGRVLGGPTPDAMAMCWLDSAKWRKLSAAATDVNLPAQSGVVICDKLRIQLDPDRPQAAVAPGSLPAAAADWLKQLAAAIEEAEEPALAGALRARLTQFVVR